MLSRLPGTTRAALALTAAILVLTALPATALPATARAAPEPPARYHQQYLTAYGDFAQGVRDMLRASRGERVKPPPWLAGVLEFVLTGTGSPYGSAQTAMACGDDAAPRDPEVYWRDVQRTRAGDPLFAPVTDNINPCAFWDRPRERPTRIRDDLPALLVSATGDPRTSHEGAEAVREMWPSSRLVTLERADQHAVYGVYGSACADEAVNAYLATGRLAARDIGCAAPSTR